VGGDGGVHDGLGVGDPVASGLDPVSGVGDGGLGGLEVGLGVGQGVLGGRLGGASGLEGRPDGGQLTLERVRGRVGGERRRP
jgi:hypothetical protein